MDINTTDKVQARDSTTGTSTSTTWRCPYTKPKAEQGWECPRCGRINAPWVRQCDCSRNNTWDKWDITWNKDDYTKPWWYDYKVTCNGTPIQAQIDSNTFKVHPETTIWKTPSSICSADSSKQDPNVSTTAWSSTTQPIEGGSDYWDEINKTWTNTPNVSNSITSEDNPWSKYFTLTSDKIKELQVQINNLKENK